MDPERNFVGFSWTAEISCGSKKNYVDFSWKYFERISFSKSTRATISIAFHYERRNVRNFYNDYSKTLTYFNTSLHKNQKANLNRSFRIGWFETQETGHRKQDAGHRTQDAGNRSTKYRPE